MSACPFEQSYRDDKESSCYHVRLLILALFVSKGINRSMWGRNGTQWDWYGANAKCYVKKSVSLIIKHEVEQWEVNSDGALERADDLHPIILDQYGCTNDLVPRMKIGRLHTLVLCT